MDTGLVGRTSMSIDITLATDILAISCESSGSVFLHGESNLALGAFEWMSSALT